MALPPGFALRSGLLRAPLPLGPPEFLFGGLLRIRNGALSSLRSSVLSPRAGRAEKG